MSIQNTFPVFEPDQVLTNNHLNDMLNYLEQQERLTRCKLLGSGIVCGLEITFQEGPDNEDSIEISKGCGLTSQGYIITMCDSIYKRYIPYSRKNFPEHLKLLLQCGQESGESKINFYGEGSDNSVLELITEKVFDELDNDEKKKVKLLNQNKKIKMDSYAVVLFLEAEELDLKNCDTNDCNDKGSRMEFEVKALLVDKALLREKRGSTNKPVLHHIELKRYNVPVNDLKSADDVLNEFDRLTDDTTIKILSEDLSYCYENYKYLLKDENTNPFTSLNSDLQKHKKFILKDFPVLIQYFYDFVDDLIKAFYEFKHKVYDVMSECCGDEMRFPFHLMLGKATASTNSGVRSEYRQYFIYSPLFDSQNTKLNEIRCLFTRMKLMYEEFLLTEKQFKENRGFLDQVVKITPSRYGHVYLSDRCIPYYYNVTDKGKELYQYWNYNKTRRGNARFNLSYNSNKYSSSAPVVSPLEYDTERFNFFRVEGHIGKSINTAMPEVKKVQQVNNLPFDIIPLSADLFGTLLRGEDPKCIIQDLESDYRVLIAEFICKLHEVFCFYSGLTFRNTVSFIGSIAGNTRSAGPSVNEIEYAKILIESASKKNVNLNQTFASLLVNRFQASKTYRKGDTLSELCDPVAGTIGSSYLKNVKNNIFKNPVGNQNDFQSHIFEFIDRIENMFLILMSNELSELNISGFKKEYEKFEEEAKWLGIVQLLILGVIESKKNKRNSA
ncbi:MAG: hypothetical protein IPL53_20885 [Ignavibacteria bacterium]|nr:hypothetical protein [Ignavibacteria bacterium]